MHIYSKLHVVLKASLMTSTYIVGKLSSFRAEAGDKRGEKKRRLCLASCND